MLSRVIKQTFSKHGAHDLYGLSKFGFQNNRIKFNISMPELYELGMDHSHPADPDTAVTNISNTGALIAYSGLRTGRSPTDKRVVKDENTQDNVWWGHVNIPLSTDSFKISEQIAIDYLNTRPRLYVVDGYAGWDPKYRQKIRIVCSRAYHALFMRNMLIRPTQQEIRRDFLESEPDFHVFNAGEVAAPFKHIPGLTSQTTVQLNFTENQSVILGTQYAGEMQKGIFSLMNYHMPLKGHLSMHASATTGKSGDVTVYFGLSGTGKTTLSADPNRSMLGDDEHVWTDSGVFNIEGGCYAKAIGLSKEQEPDIYNAIQFGAILENVLYQNELTREVDYDNINITENTRACYPLEHMKNAIFPSMAGHPTNIIFLTCDAFGVLPPISQLNPEQAMFHFISGYTAKVAGTEMGVKEPKPIFSSCFGEPFLPLHPTYYADLLAQKLKKHNTNVWLINTGWTGGKVGIGKRMSLKVTRKIIDNIHDGTLDKSEFDNFPVFNMKIPRTLPGVPSDILNPKNTWSDKNAFDSTVAGLAQLFNDNFKQFADKASQEVKDAAPRLA